MGKANVQYSVRKLKNKENKDSSTDIKKASKTLGDFHNLEMSVSIVSSQLQPDNIAIGRIQRSQVRTKTCVVKPKNQIDNDGLVTMPNKSPIRPPKSPTKVDRSSIISNNQVLEQTEDIRGNTKNFEQMNGKIKINIFAIGENQDDSALKGSYSILNRKKLISNNTPRRRMSKTVSEFQNVEKDYPKNQYIIDKDKPQIKKGIEHEACIIQLVDDNDHGD